MSLAYECDELLVARRASDTGAWSLSVASMEWSSRGGCSVAGPACEPCFATLGSASSGRLLLSHPLLTPIDSS